jgi:acetyl esterase/lipase
MWMGMMMSRSFRLRGAGALILLFVYAASIHGQQSSVAVRMQLWSGPAPLALGEKEADAPWLDVYLPANNPTRTGVVVCPGGGYSYLAVDKEGTRIAKWLTDRGVAAFVLHYRVAPYAYPAPMLDGLRATRSVRSRAAELGIAEDHVGVWGFSAGGHVASYLMTHFDGELPKAAGYKDDAIDAQSARPNFGILAYAVISMAAGTTHPGSRANLIGNGADAKLEAEVSNERNVRDNSPPAFLFATSDDPVVPVANSVLFYQAYVAKHLPVEMHLVEHGPHGVALAETLPGGDMWPNLLAYWMNRHGWMAKAAAQ